jgi:hypothetical protein
MILYRPKIGSLLGLVFLTPILLWQILLIYEFISRCIDNNKIYYKEAIIMMVLLLLIFLGVYQSTRIVFNRQISWEARNDNLKLGYKVFLTCIPLSLILAWIVSIAIN